MLRLIFFNFWNLQYLIYYKLNWIFFSDFNVQRSTFKFWISFSSVQFNEPNNWFERRSFFIQFNKPGYPHPAAQEPCADPPLEAHSPRVKQVPLRPTSLLLPAKKGERNALVYLLFIPWQGCSAGAVGVVELHQAEEGHDLKDEAVFHLSGRLKNSFCRRIPLPSRSTLLVKLESLLPLAEAVAEFAKATRIATRSVAASDLISDLLFGSDWPSDGKFPLQIRKKKYCWQWEIQVMFQREEFSPLFSQLGTKGACVFICQV